MRGRWRGDCVTVEDGVAVECQAFHCLSFVSPHLPRYLEWDGVSVGNAQSMCKRYMYIGTSNVCCVDSRSSWAFDPVLCAHHGNRQLYSNWVRLVVRVSLPVPRHIELISPTLSRL